MSHRLTCIFGILAVFALPVMAEDAAKPDGVVGENKGIPADLIDDQHVREELAVNEFTAPSISKLFDTLQFLMPLPVVEVERKMPARMPLDRADLAIELGFLIADGFLVVQAEQLEKVEDLAKDLTRYGKALGAGDRVNRHAASLLDSAKKKDVAQLKKELAATQRDVEAELVTLRDADLAHLISLGGWIRALEVSTVAVDKQFSEERARKVMREDIADYYTESVAGLEPRISERPNYLEMRDLLAGLRTEMVLDEGEKPTLEMMKDIRKQAAKLVELALQRKQ
jgi:predicted outer membrane lipoprotein